MNERRKYVRISENDIISYQVMPHTQIASRLSRDLSIGGIRFITDVFIPLGSVIKLKIELQYAKKTVTGIGKIVWISSVFSDERFEAGAEFIEINDEDFDFLKFYVTKRIRDSNPFKDEKPRPL